MITIDRKPFAKALARLTPYSATTHSWQRLARVAIETETDSGDPVLVVEASNGVDFASVMLPVSEHDGEAEAAVPLDLLRGVVAASRADSVEVAFAGHHLVVSDDAGRAKLLGHPADTVPRLPVQKVDAASLVVQGDRDLCDAIGAAAETAAKESSRYAISAVLVRADGTVVSTDGRLMQIVRASARPGGDASLLLPRMLAAEVARWRHVNLYETERIAYATCDAGDDGEWLVGSTSSGHAFPPWESARPQEPGANAIVGDAGEIASALLSAMSTMDEDRSAVRIAIESGRAMIESKSESGESRVAVPGRVSGDGAIGINPAQARRLLAASAKVADGEVEIRWGDATKPISYTRGDQWRAVQMPTAMA